MTQLNVGSVPEHFTLPWHLALASDEFKQRSIAIQWQDYPGGTGEMMADIRSHQLDIAIALTEGVVADIIRHDAGKIAQVYVRSPLTWGVHVAANASYQTIDDLEGRTFAVSRMGSGSHLMASVMAKHRGWDTNHLSFRIVGGMEGARQALASGEAEAFMWEKSMTQPVVDQGEFSRVGEFDTPWPCFVVMVRNEVLEQNTTEVKEILEIIQRSAKQFTLIDDAAEKVAHRYHLTLAEAQIWLSKTQWAKNFSVSAGMLNQVMDSLLDCGIIPERLEPSRLCSSLADLTE